MRVQVVLTPVAKAEYDAAHTWYELQRIGLGKRFRAAVRKCFQHIKRTPLAKAIVRPPDIRRSLIDGFPYVVYYRVVGSTIRVVAVFQAQRDPAHWQKQADDDVTHN